jgi:hypothetical protein
MMMRSRRIQRRIGRCWLITGVGVMLASCGGMTQPNFAHTSPWLGGTLTYTTVSGDPGTTAGSSSPFEGEVWLPEATSCPTVLDGIVQRTRPLVFVGSFDSADPASTVPTFGPFGTTVAIDPRDRHDDHVTIFDSDNSPVPNVPQTPEQLASTDAKQNYVVDDQSLHYERPSDDQLIARLSATNGLEQSVDLRLDLVCHPVP